VVAAEPTLVAVLPSARFIELLRAQAGVTFTLLQRLTGMVRMGDVRIMELSTLAATQRVYAELLRMARPDAAVPSLWVIHPLPPLREIASRISTTRETVARALSQLYPTGLVRRKGKSLYIPDRDKFEQTLAALQREGGGHHHV
jgi:CRP-like cAMP-binding protein